MLTGPRFTTQKPYNLFVSDKSVVYPVRMVGEERDSVTLLLGLGGIAVFVSFALRLGGLAWIFVAAEVLAVVIHLVAPLRFGWLRLAAKEWGFLALALLIAIYGEGWSQVFFTVLVILLLFGFVLIARDGTVTLAAGLIKIRIPFMKKDLRLSDVKAAWITPAGFLGSARERVTIEMKPDADSHAGRKIYVPIPADLAPDFIARIMSKSEGTAQLT
jgi:hypothetical protein